MSKDSPRPSPDPKIDSIVAKKPNEATETDLWDMDFGEEKVPSPPENVQRAPGQLPAQRKSESKISTKKPSELRPKSAAGDELTELRELTAEALEPEPTPEEQTGSSKHRAAKKPAYKPEAANKTGTATRTDIEDEDDVEIPELEQSVATPKWEETENDEADPIDLKPVPIIPPVGSLSKIEKIAISGLVAALALGAILSLIHFYSQVPTRPLVAEEVDFPVSGKIIEITAASTYWRQPATTGEKADVVRRGTQLIPVVKLSLNSKSGAIRVFFRNEDGLVVGDGITRSVKGSTEVIVPATAGFEDVGMHTAYRTGDGKRWIVQVFEAPSATAPREKFHKLLETEISTQIR